jgi:thiol-disulfide isomerase/thioredoxin
MVRLIVYVAQTRSHSWCGPCKVLSPILEKIAQDANVKTGSGRPIDLVTVDTEEHGALAQSYDVRVAPVSYFPSRKAHGTDKNFFFLPP